MRKVRWVVVIAEILCLLACVHAPEIEVIGYEMRRCGSFDSIKLRGPFDVRLETGVHPSALGIRADALALVGLITEVKDGVLSVQCEQDCAKYGQIKLLIQTQHVRAFAYEGKGRVEANHLHEPVLDLSLRNRGLSTFSGYLGLRHVLVGNGGTAIFKGVDTRYLEVTVEKHSKAVLLGKMRLTGMHVRGGSELILNRVTANRLVIREYGDTILHLVGEATTLDAELWGHAQFRGKAFKVHNTFVKTHDWSLAEISTMNHQHILATDASHIYFYHLPHTKADFMAYDGSVINMEALVPARFGYDPWAPDN